MNNSMDVEIDIATAEELPQLADLLVELFTLESVFRPDRDNQLRGLRLIFDTHLLGQLFVLRVGGKVAGMANTLITISTAEGRRVLLENGLCLANTAPAGWDMPLDSLCDGVGARPRHDKGTLLADHKNQASLIFITSSALKIHT